MLRTGRLISSNAMSRAVARQTELSDAARNQQARVRGTMRCMTRNTPFGFYWSMFVNKRTLFVDVTLDAGCVGAGGEPRLLQLKTAVRIVAVAALHCSFQNLMMEGHEELMLLFLVATQAQLRFACLQQLYGGYTGLLRIRSRLEDVRRRKLPANRL